MIARSRDGRSPALGGHCRAAAGARRAAALLFLALLPRPGTAGESGNPLPPEPGLVAEYRTRATSFRRIDAKVAFDWREGVPDERLPQGTFQVTWGGLLFVRDEGSYRFALAGNGVRAVLKIGEASYTFDTESADRGRTEPLDLEYGLHPFRLEAECGAPGDGGPSLRLLWSYEGEDWTVVPAAAFFHRKEAEREIAGDLLYEEGRRLAEALRCHACHAYRARPVEGPEQLRVKRLRRIHDRAPLGPLLHRSAWVRPSWLVRFLEEPSSVRPQAAMPALRLEGGARREAAQALAAYLRSVSEPAPPPLSRAPGSVPRGRALFEDLGCSRCHRPQVARGDPPPPEALAGKRPLHILVELLRKPREFLPYRHMPDFRLEEPEAVDIAAYLESLLPPAPPGGDPGGGDLQSADLARRGRRLFVDAGCGACHEDPEEDRPPPQAPPLAGRKLERGCTVPGSGPLGMPSYTLGALEVRALEAYFSSLGESPAPVAPFELARRTFEETLRCLRCHERDGRGGARGAAEIGPPAPVQGEPAAGGAGAVLLPARARNEAPSLTWAGDRLKTDWIRSVLRGEPVRARPWLQIRMPQFSLSADAVEALAQWFAASDRAAPPSAQAAGTPPGKETLDPETEAAALELLGPRGFNCLNCHYLGDYRPPADTVGPDLALAGRRLERRWFFKWLEAPGRLVPGTPMPAYLAAVPELLGGDLEKQKDALWRYLASGKAQASAIARGGESVELRASPERVRVVLARIRGGKGLRSERGLAATFPEGLSVAFDGERIAWLGSWSGVFLKRVGEHGAHAWWRPGAEPLGFLEDGASVFLSGGGGRWRGPALFRGRLGFVDGVEAEAQALRIRYRLRLQEAGWLRVEETLEVSEAEPRSFVLRRRLVLTPPLDPDGRFLVVPLLAELVGLGAKPAEGAGARAGAPARIGESVAYPRGVVRVLEVPQGAFWTLPQGEVEYPVLEPLSDDPEVLRGPHAPEKRRGAGRLGIAARAPARGGTLPFAFELRRLDCRLEPPRPPARQSPPAQAAQPSPRQAAGGEADRKASRGAVAPPAAGEKASPERPPPKAASAAPVRTQAGGSAEAALERESAPQSARPGAPPQPAARPPAAFPLETLEVPEGYTAERLPLPEDFLVCGLAFKNGVLYAGGYDGEVRRVVDADGDGLPDRYEPFADCLGQATSLHWLGEELAVASPQAVYTISDRNGDGIAEHIRVLSSDWDYSGHPFDWFFGFAWDARGNLYGANTTPHERGKVAGLRRRGEVLRIAPDGTTETVATGTRYEFGWTTDASGRSFFTVNQGPWNITCAIHELREGAFYGYGGKPPEGYTLQVPVVRVPYPWCRSLTGLAFAETGGRFGVLEGQGFAGDYNTRRVIRWTWYDAGGVRQGACYDFALGFDAAPTGLAFGPDGALYVGAMIDGAWYPGRPRGAIYRIRRLGDGRDPFLVLEARATAEGFLLLLSAPPDPRSIENARVHVHRYFHEYRGGYYSVETHHEDVPVASVALLPPGAEAPLSSVVSAPGPEPPGTKGGGTARERREQSRPRAPSHRGRTKGGGTALEREAPAVLGIRLQKPHAAPRIYRIAVRGLRDRTGRELPSTPFFATVHAVPAGPK